ncbi:hypothetical protein D9756_010000 [Leucocoprinus leucothites]|uniref:Transmembrane protein n=1 Tax=Leucocoprinus leucothites TaxID=201217 RepID=A0A8H5FSC0_9AGAR|nr:hypothetical protein D9756_010000 [Leucoagaricus leucothites]
MSVLNLYYDESSFNLQYSPPTAWADNSSELWTSGRSKVVNQFPGAQLTFKFNGTSAMFYGASLNDSKFAPMIDNLVQPSVSLPSSNPPTYGLWYQTPPLQPGQHTIVFNDLPQLTLDYVIVGIDPSTVFQNTLVLISDSDPRITYTGNWEQDVSRFKTLQPFTFIGDYSTRSSCNPGDTLSFEFSGSSLQMWGVFDWQLVGDVTAAYTIDGQQVAQQRYQADTTSQQRIDGVQTNYQLFTHDSLTDGVHTLTVNITSCTNQRFSLDYITYTPSFTSGKDAPASTAPPTSSSPSASHKFPTGAIAGIVVGAVGLVAIAILILWFYRRRRKTAAEPFPASGSTTAITRKEEVPPHMRYLRPQASQGTVDLTEGTSTSGTWVVAPHPSDVRNINELVSSVPPPAYLNHQTPPAPTESMTETATATHPTSRSPS